MSELVYIKKEGEQLVAYNGYGSRVMGTYDILYSSEFLMRVRDEVKTQLDTRIPTGVLVPMTGKEADELRTANAFNRVMWRDIEGVMTKMAKRLDEIDGGDEWERLSALCWEPSKSEVVS